MRIGALDKQIIIKAKIATENTFGEPVETWISLDTVWGKKRDLRGSERYTAKQNLAGVDSVFTIRYRKDVTPLNILECENIEYEISGVVELGRKEALEIYASRGIE